MSDTRHQRAAFLGIERSLTGRRWAERLGDERIALAMAQRHGLPDAICRLLAAREVDLEGVPDFLEPTLRKFLPDPSHLKDMDAGVARLVRAVQQGERIVVFGDYDVDGATSSALLQRFFRAIGGDIGVYIPDRRKEGYGPNAPALLKLREEGASVVVTVDCGVTAYEPLAEARRAGLDVIVIDHHQAELALPEAVAVVDPNRLDEASPHKQLAAVGVAFLLCVGVNRALRAAGWYGARPEPDLRQWLDLVALGTVADVVPLTGVNRALVRQGLLVMHQRGNPGLAALADVARLREPPGAYHLGFMLGPRVNAGGRVGQADLGARLLASDDPHEVGALAIRLDEFNAERRAIEREVLDQAIARIEGLYGPDRKGLPAALVVESADWHIGVIGIVASRLVERYGRPAFVIGLDGEVGKGSGRSVRGIDLGAAVLAARQSGLL
ncbi:MAG TPA: single-stranded-DNA-specific exonuclease RecJ, partial [Reyranella sp.]|nr:single-stranded-DNA-specific exonuclease RecJ [Reyranella sp.]